MKIHNCSVNTDVNNICKQCGKDMSQKVGIISYFHNLDKACEKN